MDAPSLRAACELSEERLLDARNGLLERVPASTDAMDVVVFGSLARLESTAKSDFDFLVVAHGLPENVDVTRRLVSACYDVSERLNLDEPGATGLFGRVVGAADLTERIGLEYDTNATHSRRMLMLQESKSIYAPELHERLILAIVDRYLAGHNNEEGVARFLLNDMERYWRTIAVDYQAKVWERVREGWGLRYLKLIITRKLTYAASLASLFMADRLTPQYLVTQFSLPALARLAQLHPHLERELHSDLRTCFQVAEEFSAAMNEEGFREESKTIMTRDDIKEVPRFAELRNRGKELQTALERIFFDSERLKHKSRKYLSF